eukprot:PhM_4_TR11928/c0_g1_i1/m.23326
MLPEEFVVEMTGIFHTSIPEAWSISYSPHSGVTDVGWAPPRGMQMRTSLRTMLAISNSNSTLTLFSLGQQLIDSGSATSSGFCSRQRSTSTAWQLGYAFPGSLSPRMLSDANSFLLMKACVLKAKSGTSLSKVMRTLLYLGSETTTKRLPRTSRPEWPPSRCSTTLIFSSTRRSTGSEDAIDAAAGAPPCCCVGGATGAAGTPLSPSTLEATSSFFLPNIMAPFDGGATAGFCSTTATGCSGLIDCSYWFWRFTTSWKSAPPMPPPTMPSFFILLMALARSLACWAASSICFFFIVLATSSSTEDISRFCMTWSSVMFSLYPCATTSSKAKRMSKARSSSCSSLMVLQNCGTIEPKSRSTPRSSTTLLCRVVMMTR